MNLRRVALITGITGQDGSYLSELLLDKGYEVHGIMRRVSVFTTQRIEHLMDDPNFYLHYGDMGDATSLTAVVTKVRPDEVYNLAAQSHVKVSFEVPEYTAQVDALGTLRLLEAIRTAGIEGTCRFYQASTSELFGDQPAPQSEATPFKPRSPYAVAKQYAYNIVVNYREAYGMHASNGILFNHESPRRGDTFVTKKITNAVRRIAGDQAAAPLTLGNMDAYRDWGHAKDYVRAMWMVLQHDEPVDLVVATGETHSVREFVERAFECRGVTVVWNGEGVDEVGTCSSTGRVLVRVDPKFFRPTEVPRLHGDASLAKQVIGWEPQTSFDELVRDMCTA